MNIYVNVVGELMTNCYIIENEETKEVLIVDPGDDASGIAESIEERGEKPVAILLTHAHSDHIMAVPSLREIYSGLPVYIGEIEVPLLADGERNNPFGTSEGMTADHTVKEGDILCTIEAMKMMNEVRSPIDGIVKKVLALEGDLVEYNQVLFVIG